MSNKCKCEVVESSSVTIKDIAEICNISYVSVSNALAGRDKVSEATRKRIKEVAESLGYVPSSTARALNKRTMKIAVVIPALPGIICDIFRREFIHTCKSQSGIKVEMSLFCYNSIDEDGKDALNTVAKGGFDGLIISFPDVFEYRTVKQFEAINKLNIPVVSLGDKMSVLNTGAVVSVDGEMGGRLAADVMGLTIKKSDPNILAFSVDVVMPDVHKNYMNGFGNTLFYYNLYIKDIIFYTDMLDKAKKEAHAVLTNGELPDGIFVSPYCSWIICDAIKELGLEKKIVVVGTDTIPENIRCLREGLLSAIIDQRQEEQVRRVFNVLISRILEGNKSPFENIKIKPKLITRGAITE